MPVPVGFVVFAVFTVAAAPDIVQTMPSDLIRKVPIPDTIPRSKERGRTEPSAVAVYEVESVEPDDIVVPSPGNGKTLIVEVDEVGTSVCHRSGTSPDVEVKIEIRTGITQWSAEQHSSDSGGGQNK
jgi:hypothetical protein